MNDTDGLNLMGGLISQGWFLWKKEDDWYVQDPEDEVQGPFQDLRELLDDVECWWIIKVSAREDRENWGAFLGSALQAEEECTRLAQWMHATATRRLAIPDSEGDRMLILTKRARG